MSFVGGEIFRGENLVSLLGAVTCVSGIVYCFNYCAEGATHERLVVSNEDICPLFGSLREGAGCEAD